MVGVNRYTFLRDNYPTLFLDFYGQIYHLIHMVTPIIWEQQSCDFRWAGTLIPSTLEC